MLLYNVGSRLSVFEIIIFGVYVFGLTSTRESVTLRLMTVKTITLNLPETIYLQIQYIAQLWRKPAESILVETVATGISLLEDLPSDMVDDMSALLLLNDAALGKAACRTLSDKKYQKLDELLVFQGMRKLCESEQKILDELIQEQETILITRAQAAILLKQRGYDVSDPTIFNSYNNQPPLFHQQLLGTV